jgi:hypothetical protein
MHGDHSDTSTLPTWQSQQSVDLATSTRKPTAQHEQQTQWTADRTWAVPLLAVNARCSRTFVRFLHEFESSKKRAKPKSPIFIF